MYLTTTKLCIEKMHRYLMHISYIGTRFRGAQKSVSLKSTELEDTTSVQGQLEIGLKLLKSKNYPFVHLSSRTDTGVHAFNSTVHVDLERYSGTPYPPKIITLCLNKYLRRNNLSLRVLKTYLVPSTFNCRFHAISRTYLFRIAIIKSDSPVPLLEHVPIEEYKRCFFLCTSTFDVNKAQSCCELFKGFHDFRTFMGSGAKKPHKITRRTIEKIEITEGKPLLASSYSRPSKLYNKNLNHQYWDITMKSSGFLHNQVRRIVGTLIAAAQGKVSCRDIQLMLQIPSHLSWDPRIKTAPSHGLYLCEVDYLQRDLETFKEEI